MNQYWSETPCFWYCVSSFFLGASSRRRERASIKAWFMMTKQAPFVATELNDLISSVVGWLVAAILLTLIYVTHTHCSAGSGVAISFVINDLSVTQGSQWRSEEDWSDIRERRAHLYSYSALAAALSALAAIPSGLPSASFLPSSRSIITNYISGEINQSQIFSLSNNHKPQASSISCRPEPPLKCQLTWEELFM